MVNKTKNSRESKIIVSVEHNYDTQLLLQGLKREETRFYKVNLLSPTLLTTFVVY